MRDRQTQTARTEPTWEEDPVSGTAQNFCFLFGFRFVLFLFFFLVFFFFFLHSSFLAGFLYCVLEWAQHFYLIYVDISLPCLLFYVTFRSPLSLPPCLRCGWQFVWLLECLYFPLLFRLCVQKPQREREKEKGRGGERGWCIYFVSTCSWYLFYESNYLYWNMAYTWDSCVVLRHISQCYFWRACAEILCCSSW